MDLNQLMSFRTVAHRGSFSGAARELHLSQPALSRQISSLENHLEVRLFVRHKNGVTLTDAGRRLLFHADRIGSISGEAGREIREISDPGSGEVTVLLHRFPATALLPQVLLAMQRFSPEIQVAVREENGFENIPEQLLEGLADIALVADGPEDVRLTREILGQDELRLMVPPDHQLLLSEIPGPAELARERFVFSSGQEAEAVRESLNQGYSLILPVPHLLLDSQELVKRSVQAGLGITAMPVLDCAQEIRDSLLIAHPHFMVRRVLQAVYPRGRRMSPALLAFLASLKKTFSRLDTEGLQGFALQQTPAGTGREPRP